MNRHGAIELDWADGTHTFRLGLREIEELEEKRGTSIFTLARRLSPSVREPRVLDLVETLRLGLIGGGKDPATALTLVRRYVEERPLDESRDAAYAVAVAALARVHPGDLGDKPGEEQAVEPSGSTSPQSTPQPQSSASPISEASPSGSGRLSSTDGDGRTGKSRSARPRTRNSKRP